MAINNQEEQLALIWSDKITVCLEEFQDNENIHSASLLNFF